MKKSDLKNYNRLLKEENEVVNETLEHVLAALFEQEKDLNDLQGDWAHEYIKSVDLHEADMACSDMTLREFQREIEILTEGHDRLRGNIRELKRENAELKEQAKTDEITKDNLLKKVFELREKVGKLETRPVPPAVRK